ncbi:xanthine dehydrogenase family protein molybdopterin-binding subunit [Saccharobesus litoralis]|uniref:Xanthine dehydrogenase family protein molybdopterin-binding subunit n=1 Tax=Saccharobesus litoralis TaxID=2172099 RepID=A0A2S0VLR8_9ALTE|nr:molybdopterin cofactor-binding domain-containing protein [Saccharobesus litoralis]AWB65135.1 xanthine dehydrogenase family protein molybdopterin-binding subunit [Saccharobesus litoralis]
MNTFILNRRDFLTLTGISGTGLLLGCTASIDPQTPIVPLDTTPQSLNLFVAIRPDNTVDIVNHRSEMGQGAKTGVIQMIAEELEADWDKINVIQGLGNRDYGSQNTDASSSVRKFYTKLRQVGASARTMLEQAAANYWQIELSQVKAQNHRVTNQINGNSLSFGDLAELAAKQAIPDAKSLTYKKTKAFKLIKQSIPIVDLQDMTSGNTTYGIDVELPDLLIAVIARCPVLHGKVVSFDATATKQIPGVVDVIQMPQTANPVLFKPVSGVAVLATNTWAAKKGRDALKIKWDLGSNKNYNSDKALNEMLDRAKQNAKITAFKGDIKQGFSQAKTIIEAQYQVPFEAHTPMEPPAATAYVQQDNCEIWAATQNPQAVMKHVSALLGIKQNQVKANVTLLGGGFGRKAKADFAVEAAYLSQQSAKPVKVVWTREDDIQAGYFHAGSAQYIKAGVDNNQQITAWLQRTVIPTIGSTFNAKAFDPQNFELSMGFNDLPYDVQNLQSEATGAPVPARIGWMRSVCNIQHAFAIHSFIDELAHAQGIAPNQFLRQAYGQDRQVNPFNDFNFKKYGNYSEKFKKHPILTSRYKGVLDKLEHLVDFAQPLASGQGWGLAIHRSFVSYVGVATKVEIKNNRLRVLDCKVVVDCGIAVNPDRVKAQMEGAIAYGLTIALQAKIDFKQGAVKQSNFHDYPPLRINQCPKIEVVIIESDHAPGGVGEPGVPPVAPSVTNAIFAATGKRYRKLPLNQYFSV